MNVNKEKLIATIKLHQEGLAIQKEILLTVLPIVEGWDKRIDKRLVTAIDTKLGEVYGMETVKNWALNGQDKAFPNVWTGYSKDKGWNNEPRYNFTFYYHRLLEINGLRKRAKELNANIDESIQWPSCESIEGLKRMIQNRIVHIDEVLPERIRAIQDIDAIIAQAEKVQEEKKKYTTAIYGIQHIIQDFISV